ncbi:proteasome ATPase [Corynebacterium bovis]|uniref:AAA ATPase forming ring-shaped complexes n=1 Tax=Corynebacterium bovis DSM 20582 = CIP 54.80 TaxID=927655 RepID=A0A8I0CM32_9CORY|nr:proteasome ATPase [Corynebacterium bovis]MBB3115228.1 proteasome-associated ATPase [Corynebacterium bovis DSM 20582 = CIP 54.80]QQC47825.1 proteasome ATPase [Corynebacterium bovis]RRO80572.1 proteasome ATPase [Corynebacterium bovis]RRO83263.1 proteasome ATPase [Corynebacterium bovis]RRO83429.1 proteasome ATPase [Corynebacterium bovis]
MTQHTETPGTTHGPEGHGGPTSPVDSGPASYRDLQLANRRLGSRNEQLLAALQASRAKLSDMNERLAALSEPPSTYGVLIEPGPAGTGTAEIFTANRRMRVQVAPTVDTDSLVPGATVRLADGLQVVEVTGYADSGDVATVVEVVDSRIVVADKMGEETLVTCAGPLRREAAAGRVGAGDSVIVDRRAGYAFEVIARAEVEDLVLEEVPDVTYGDIGGLSAQIEQIHDAVELPFLHPDLYREYGLLPPKGVLLYGPPGCGKTLIAKAVANSLASKMSASGDTRSYFLNVKGPELLNKFVGETERQIRLIFERARAIASEGRPVIIFFDEMEAIFRTRGTGKSSDMEATVVPQLLAEIDGVENLRNVIVIGASNREELIDPAILRPGRLDVKIRVERPDRDGALEILAKRLTVDLPLAPGLVEECGGREGAAAHLRERIVDTLYSPDRSFVMLHFADGTSTTLTYGDVASGAMLTNIVDRAKTAAIKEALHAADGSDPRVPSGLDRQHVDRAVAEEIRDNEDLPDTTNPAEWARIAGHSSRRVVDLTVVG